MRTLLAFVAAFTALALAATHVSARLQPDMMCVDPAVEFPVACYEDDD